MSQEVTTTSSQPILEGSDKDQETISGSEQDVEANRRPPNDEIDLLEIALFIWQQRAHIGAGVGVGLCVSAGLALFSTGLYVTRIPVSFDPASFPAILDMKKVVDTYSSALSSPDVAFSAFDSLFKISPSLANASDSKTTVASLVAQQSMTQSKSANLPLKLLPALSSTDFFVETTFPMKGMGSQAPEALLQAINSAGTTYNSIITATMTTAANARLVEAETAVKALNESYEKAQLTRYKAQTRIRSELAKIEYKLLKLAPQKSVISNFVAPPQFILQQNPLTNSSAAQEQRDDQQSLQRVLRLKAALLEDSRITMTQSDELDSQISNLLVHSSMAEGASVPMQTAAKGVFEKLAAAQQNLVAPVDRQNSFVPLFKLNKQLIRQMDETSQFEKKSRKTTLVLAGGSILGGLLGFFIGGIQTLIKKNKSKFRSIFAKT